MLSAGTSVAFEEQVNSLVVKVHPVLYRVDAAFEHGLDAGRGVGVSGDRHPGVGRLPGDRRYPLGGELLVVGGVLLGHDAAGDVHFEEVSLAPEPEAGLAPALVRPVHDGKVSVAMVGHPLPQDVVNVGMARRLGHDSVAGEDARPGNLALGDRVPEADAGSTPEVPDSGESRGKQFAQVRSHAGGPECHVLLDSGQ